MAQIQILLEKQLLTIQNTDIIASGDSNFDSCIFTFDSLWDGFTKTAVFYQDKANVQYAVLSSDDTCMIPAAAMARAGRMYLGVFGIKDTAVVTSTLGMIDIKEGAISGGNVSTEPTDDVFLAIIAQYQSIVDKVAQQNKKLDEANVYLEEQTEILKKLNAFETEALEKRMSAMEITLDSYGEKIGEEIGKMDNMLEEIKNSAFLIADVPVVFNNNLECIIEDERVTQRSVVNAYFDAVSVENSLNHAVYVESFDGYIKFSTTTKFVEELNCTIEVRRY